MCDYAIYDQPTNNSLVLPRNFLLCKLELLDPTEGAVDSIIILDIESARECPLRISHAANPGRISAPRTGHGRGRMWR